MQLCAGCSASSQRGRVRDDMRELHLFAGAGGGILGGLLLGHRPVCAVEVDDYCREVLLARQADGCLPRFPVYQSVVAGDREQRGFFDDPGAFDGKQWRGRAEVVCGGWPCQDLSLAGSRKGLKGRRSALVWDMLRIVGEVEPRFVFMENVPGLLSADKGQAFGQILGSLADLGFDAEWCVLSAADCGAPHLRKRLWILAAHPDRKRCLGGGGARQDDAGRDQSANSGSDVADANRTGSPERQGQRSHAQPQRSPVVGGGLQTAADWWATEPNVGRVAHGVASRVDRLKAIGNGQVPIVAASAWRILEERLNASDQLQRDRLPRLDPRHV